MNSVQNANEDRQLAQARTASVQAYARIAPVFDLAPDSKSAALTRNAILITGFH